VEASTSWNPQGLSRPVMGSLYLFTICKEPIVFVTSQKCQNSGKDALLQTDTKLAEIATQKSGNSHKQSRLPQLTFHLHSLRKYRPCKLRGHIFGGDACCQIKPFKRWIKSHLLCAGNIM